MATRIEIHVDTMDEADEVRARYVDSPDEIVIIVNAPATPDRLPPRQPGEKG